LLKSIQNFLGPFIKNIQPLFNYINKIIDNIFKFLVSHSSFILIILAIVAYISLVPIGAVAIIVSVVLDIVFGALTLIPVVNFIAVPILEVVLIGEVLFVIVVYGFITTLSFMLFTTMYTRINNIAFKSFVAVAGIIITILNVVVLFVSCVCVMTISLVNLIAFVPVVGIISQFVNLVVGLIGAVLIIVFGLLLVFSVIVLVFVGVIVYVFSYFVLPIILKIVDKIKKNVESPNQNPLIPVIDFIDSLDNYLNRLVIKLDKISPVLFSPIEFLIRKFQALMRSLRVFLQSYTEIPYLYYFQSF
jgi:hypothetical protein